MNDYKQLEVWKCGFRLAVLTYSITKTFPPEEKFGLVSQMRRAASSIIANIAEGYRQPSRKAYLRYIRTSFGSASELETHFQLANALNLIQPPNFTELNNLLNSVLRMLNRLCQVLSKESYASSHSP